MSQNKISTQRRRDAKAQKGAWTWPPLSSKTIGRLRALTACMLQSTGALRVQDIRDVMRANGKDEVRRWLARGKRLMKESNKRVGISVNQNKKEQ